LAYWATVSAERFSIPFRRKQSALARILLFLLKKRIVNNLPAFSQQKSCGIFLTALRLLFFIELAGDIMVWDNFAQLRIKSFAALGTFEAARTEAASRRRVNGAGHVAIQHNALMALGWVY
jgi:hypothetical protein